MKNTIKILTLSLFLCITTISTAQDASNDATWEETVDFIKSKLGSMRAPHNTKKYEGHLQEFDLSNELINRKLFIIKDIELINNEGYFTQFLEVDLENIINSRRVDIIEYEISENGENKKGIRLTLSGKNGVEQNYERVQYEDALKSKRSTKRAFEKLDIIIEDSDMLIRLDKAFQHIAYLAKEKRKQSKF